MAEIEEEEELRGFFRDRNNEFSLEVTRERKGEVEGEGDGEGEGNDPISMTSSDV